MAQDNTKGSWYEGTIKGLSKADAMTVIEKLRIFAELTGREYSCEDFSKFRFNFRAYTELGDRIKALRDYIINNDDCELAKKVINIPYFNTLIPVMSKYRQFGAEHDDKELQEQMSTCIRNLSSIIEWSKDKLIDKGSTDEKGHLIGVLNTGKGIEILQRGVRKGYFNDDFTLKKKRNSEETVLTKGQMYVFVVCASIELMEDKNQWHPFEHLWGIQKLKMTKRSDCSPDKVGEILELFTDCRADALEKLNNWK